MKKKKYKKIIRELATDNGNLLKSLLTTRKMVKEQNTALEDRILHLEDRILCLLAMENQYVISAIVQAEAEDKN